MKALLQQDSDRLYFTSDAFLDEDGAVFHGFFGRNGGASKDVYCSLNCGVGSSDAIEHISHNRGVVAKAAGCGEAGNLLSLYQVHGDQCHIVGEPWAQDERPEGDAFVSDVKGLALGILTADCAPVLFSAEKEDGSAVIGAAHAGWGGALKGVLGSTVDKMLALGAVKDSIRACIGPCIGQASYEVSEDFARSFMEEDDENERFFISAQREGHLMFDLAGYCAFKLFKAGIKNVFIKDLDTYFNEEDFYSYRRATHRGEKDYGRQISVIMIK